MSNPFENFNVNDDQEIYNLMRLNPDMTYVKGYKNIFCEKNNDNNNIINHKNFSELANNKYQYNYDNNISNNNQNKIAPNILNPNNIVRGNNFSIYDINNNKISNNGPPDQFKSAINEKNNNIKQNIFKIN